MACFFFFPSFWSQIFPEVFQLQGNKEERFQGSLIIQNRIAKHENLFSWPPLSLNTFKTMFDGREINKWLLLWVDNLNHRIFGLLLMPRNIFYQYFFNNKISFQLNEKSASFPQTLFWPTSEFGKNADSLANTYTNFWSLWTKMSRFQFPKVEKSSLLGFLGLTKNVDFSFKNVEERGKYAYEEPSPSLLSN